MTIFNIYIYTHIHLSYIYVHILLDIIKKLLFQKATLYSKLVLFTTLNNE